MAMNKTQLSGGNQNAVRYLMIGLLALAAFFGAYRFAQANSVSAAARDNAAVVAASAASPAGGAANAPAGAPGAGAQGAGGSCCGGAGGASGAGGCCGGGSGSTATVPGKTTVTGGVQKVAIDLTTGSYSPNQITAKAGIPLELDFKGPASGCNGAVVSQQLGFQQDVSNGGVIKIGALQPGTYQWTCGMGMYIGRIVVQ